MKLNSILMMLLLLHGVSKLQGQTDTSFAFQKPLFDFDYDKSPFKLTGEQLANTNKHLRFYILTRYRAGVDPIVGPFNVNFRRHNEPAMGTATLQTFNASIEDMLTGNLRTKSEVILEVKDASKYRYEEKYGNKLNWMRKNAYCFELRMPAGAFTSASVYLAEQCKTLGLEVVQEKRMVNTLVLFRTSTADKLKSAIANTGANGIYDKKGNFTSCPLDYMGNLLMDAGYPVMFNETNYKGGVDMKLDIADWKDLNAIRKALQRYDLDLKEEQRERNVFVITALKTKS